MSILPELLHLWHL